MGLSTQFGWVKDHVRIDGNEKVDLMAKTRCRESLLPQVTEGGVKAYWKEVRGRERDRKSVV